MDNKLKVINFNKGVIETNFEEFHKAIKLKIEDYKNLVVTEDNLTTMKQTRLELTRSIKIINEKRIAQKKKFLEPLDRFEGDVKTAISTIEVAEKQLKSQIDVFDEKVRQEKLEYARTTKTKMLGLVDLVDKYSSRIDVDKKHFTNVTTTKKQIASDIDDQIKVLMSAQGTEEENRAYVVSHCENMSKMFELGTPIIKEDVERYGIDYETMSVAHVTEIINKLVTDRKQHDDLVIKTEKERVAKIKEEKEREEPTEEKVEEPVEIATSNGTVPEPVERYEVETESKPNYTTSDDVIVTISCPTGRITVLENLLDANYFNYEME
jgi:hypothetical protein